jgi:hypothetical protein
VQSRVQAALLRECGAGLLAWRSLSIAEAPTPPKTVANFNGSDEFRNSGCKPLSRERIVAFPGNRLLQFSTAALAAEKPSPASS